MNILKLTSSFTSSLTTKLRPFHLQNEPHLRDFWTFGQWLTQRIVKKHVGYRNKPFRFEEENKRIYKKTKKFNFPFFLGNCDRQADRPTNQLTNRRREGVKREE